MKLTLKNSKGEDVNIVVNPKDTFKDLNLRLQIFNMKFRGDQNDDSQNVYDFITKARQNVIIKPPRLTTSPSLLSHSLCRLCARLCGETRIPIFSHGQQNDGPAMAEALHDCLPVTVLISDRLPKHLCVTCARLLLRFYRFRMNCLCAEAELINMCEAELVVRNRSRPPPPPLHMLVPNIVIKSSPEAIPTLASDFQNTSTIPEVHTTPSPKVEESTVTPRRDAVKILKPSEVNEKQLACNARNNPQLLKLKDKNLLFDRHIVPIASLGKHKIVKVIKPQNIASKISETIILKNEPSSESLPKKDIVMMSPKGYDVKLKPKVKKVALFPTNPNGQKYVRIAPKSVLLSPKVSNSEHTTKVFETVADKNKSPLMTNIARKKFVMTLQAQNIKTDVVQCCDGSVDVDTSKDAKNIESLERLDALVKLGQGRRPSRTARKRQNPLNTPLDNKRRKIVESTEKISPLIGSEVTSISGVADSTFVNVNTTDIIPSLSVESKSHSLEIDAFKSRFSKPNILLKTKIKHKNPILDKVTQLIFGKPSQSAGAPNEKESSDSSSVKGLEEVRKTPEAQLGKRQTKNSSFKIAIGTEHKRSSLTNTDALKSSMNERIVSKTKRAPIVQEPSIHGDAYHTRKRLSKAANPKTTSASGEDLHGLSSVKSIAINEDNTASSILTPKRPLRAINSKRSYSKKSTPEALVNAVCQADAENVEKESIIQSARKTRSLNAAFVKKIMRRQVKTSPLPTIRVRIPRSTKKQ